MKKTELLAENLGLFNELKKLAENQKELMANDHVEQFMNLSTNRDRIRRQIMANENKFGDPNSIETGRKSHDGAAALSGEIATVIQSIQDIDRKIEELIHNKRDGLLSDIKGLRNGQKALKGYGAKTVRNSRYIDRKTI